MSTTTTTTTQDYLHDYTIHLTGAPSRREVARAAQSPEAEPGSERESAPAAAPTSSVSASATVNNSGNPPGWDTQHRQVPPHRPVNTSLDRDSRPWGSNPVETAIIFTMMHGVWLKGSISWLWRKTGGRFDEEAFTTTVGGES